MAGYIEGAPDWVAEVACPSDRLTNVLEKVDEWLSGGAKSVWLVDPPRRSIDIYRDAGEVVRYGAGGVVANEPTLPGFTLRVSEVFSGA